MVVYVLEYLPNPATIQTRYHGRPFVEIYGRLKSAKRRAAAHTNQRIRSLKWHELSWVKGDAAGRGGSMLATAPCDDKYRIMLKKVF